MSHASLYRGDLLTLMDAEGMKLPPRIAGKLCGFDYTEEEVDSQGLTTTKPPPVKPSEAKSSSTSARVPARDKRKLQFWRVASHERLSSEEQLRHQQVPEKIRTAIPVTNEELAKDSPSVPGSPLLHWSRLWPFLHEVLGKKRRTRQPHIGRTIRLLATARPILRLPRKLRRAWHPSALLVLDRRPSLAVFWQDYDQLVARLRKVRGAVGLKVHEVWEQDDLPMPKVDSAVLVLGDLGQYLGFPSTDRWLLLGRRMRVRGMNPWALCPCPQERFSPKIASIWNLAVWDRGRRLPLHGRGVFAGCRESDAGVKTAKVKKLLTLTAPAIHVQTSLLRDLRFLLPHSEADVGTEYDFFQSTHGTGTLKFALNPEAARENRLGLRTMQDKLLAQSVSAIRHHHQESLEIYRHMETLGLRDSISQRQWTMLASLEIVTEQQMTDAVAYMRRMLASLLNSHFGQFTNATLRLNYNEIIRQQQAGTKPEELQILWAMANPGEERVIPLWVDPRNFCWMIPKGRNRLHPVRLGKGIVTGGGKGVLLDTMESSLSTCIIRLENHSGEAVQIERTWDAGPLLSSAELKSANSLTISSEKSILRLEKIGRPVWARRMSLDEAGLLAVVDSQVTELALRWLLPSQIFPEKTSGPKMDISLTPSLIHLEAFVGHVMLIGRPEWGRAELRSKVQWTPGSNLEGWIDEKVLALVVCELLANAFKYTPKGSIKLLAVLDKNMLGIEIADTGLGINQSDSDSLFEPYYNRRRGALSAPEGNGLGLYFVRGACRKLGGNVEIKSAGSGKGTSASISVPWSKTKVEAEALYRKAVQEVDGENVVSVENGINQRSVVLQGKGLWHAPYKPAWASRIFVDQHGLAAEFHIRKVSFVLRWIPPGRFLMGSPDNETGRYPDEGPQHEVTISQGYWLAETPVTQSQWRAVVEEGLANRQMWRKLGISELKVNPSHFDDSPELPVESVTWFESRDFCNLLSGLLPGELRFYLPSEAQWEYACRGGHSTAFNDGSACTIPEGLDLALDRLGWFTNNSGNKTHPVKQKAVNPWGLCDMHGNVWEWCSDEWLSEAYRHRGDGVIDPRLDSSNESAERVLRGGSFAFVARYCRSAARVGDLPGYLWRFQGLRLAAGQELGGGAVESGAPSAGEAEPSPEGRRQSRAAGENFSEKQKR